MTDTPTTPFHLAIVIEPQPVLKACPFCGGRACLYEAPAIGHLRAYVVKCTVCLSSGRAYTVLSVACSTWDRRVA